jgi:hypothetical protein
MQFTVKRITRNEDVKRRDERKKESIKDMKEVD